MENEIMNNEEIIETTTEEIMSNGSKGLALAVGLGVGALLILGYNKVAKPMLAKRKAKKEELLDDCDEVETMYGDVEDNE